MTIATLTCDTLELVPKIEDPEVTRLKTLLTGARRSLDAAEKVVEKRREDLAETIVEVFRTDRMKAAQIAKAVDYTPEHVRRILRAHGIEGDPTRLTPTQRAAQRAADES